MSEWSIWTPQTFRSASFLSTFSLRVPSLSKHIPDVYSLYYLLISGVKPDSKPNLWKKLSSLGVGSGCSKCPAPRVKQHVPALFFAFLGPNPWDGISVQPKTGFPTSQHSCLEAKRSESFLVWNFHLIGLLQHYKEPGGLLWSLGP